MSRHELSTEHADLRAAVEEFARSEVAPVIGDFYQRESFPYQIVAKMGSDGLFGHLLPSLSPV